MQPPSNRPRVVPFASRRGFTLLQVLLVIGIIAILSAVLMSVFKRVGAPARRAQCDVHLKQIALALDTFRDERGKLPKDLGELVSQGYVSQETLVCPADPENSASQHNSYDDFYILREPNDSKELPIVMCPFHERENSHGIQGFKGGYTKQYAVHPATLAAADVSGVVTITRPGGEVLALPTASRVLELHGGDRIKTGSGSATLRFFDTSTATVQANSELSVLQSYVDGQRSGPLYTLVRQFQGRCSYYVNPGNHFDVATPTATAGALGTRFTIDLVPNMPNVPAHVLETVLTVQEHIVALTTIDRTIDVEDTEPAVAAHDPKNKDKKRASRGSKEEQDNEDKKNAQTGSGSGSGGGGSNSGSNGSGSNSGSNGSGSNSGSNGSGSNSGSGSSGSSGSSGDPATANTANN